LFLGLATIVWLFTLTFPFIITYAIYAHDTILLQFTPTRTAILMFILVLVVIVWLHVFYSSWHPECTRVEDHNLDIGSQVTQWNVANFIAAFMLKVEIVQFFALGFQLDIVPTLTYDKNFFQEAFLDFYIKGIDVTFIIVISLITTMLVLASLMASKIIDHTRVWVIRFFNVVCNGLFLTIVYCSMMKFNCIYPPSGLPYSALPFSPSGAGLPSPTICFEGSHGALALVAMVFLVQYVPVASMIGFLFGQEADKNINIKYTKQFESLDRALKILLLYINIFFPDYKWLQIIIFELVMVLYLVAHLILHPSTIISINIWRAIVYALNIWLGFVVILATALQWRGTFNAIILLALGAVSIITFICVSGQVATSFWGKAIRNTERKHHKPCRNCSTAATKSV